MPSSTDPELVEALARHREAARPDPGHVRTLRRATVVAGVLVLAVGLQVLTGWLTGQQILTRILPQFVPTVPWTAVCFVLVGWCLVTLGRRPDPSKPSRLSGVVVLVSATVVMLLAGAMLLEDLTNTVWGIDNPYGLDTTPPEETQTPGRMAAGTQVAFLLTGLSLWFLVLGAGLRAQLLAVLTFLTGLLAVLGYLLGVDSLYSAGGSTSMALPTALALVGVGLALLGVRPDLGPMRLLTSRTAGGRLARRLVPASFFGPLLVMVLLLTATRSGLLDPRIGRALFVLLVAVLGVGLVLYESFQLRQMDLRRAGAEDLLRRAREAERDRDRALAELRRANQDLEHFAAIAAHDLKAPLASIRMYAQAIGDSPSVADDHIATHAVGQMLHATRRGNRLVDDLLALSRADNTALSPVRVDLVALARTVADEQLAHVGRGRVRVEGPIPTAYVDRALVRQALSNLLGNALRYVPADRDPDVRVWGEHDAEGRVRLRIADNGPGVPVEEREDIFAMFHRGTRTRELDGSGVGLAISRRIAERHGGALTVDENVPEGSIFSLALPAA